MAEQSAGSGEPRWLLKPRPGEVQIHVAIGEGAELTPELREALEALASALGQEEVEGYARGENICTTKACPERISCDRYISASSPELRGVGLPVSGMRS
jgi:hypothetical protein